MTEVVWLSWIHPLPPSSSSLTSSQSHSCTVSMVTLSLLTTTRKQVKLVRQFHNKNTRENLDMVLSIYLASKPVTLATREVNNVAERYRFRSDKKTNPSWVTETVGVSCVVLYF